MKKGWDVPGLFLLGKEMTKEKQDDPLLEFPVPEGEDKKFNTFHEIQDFLEDDFTQLHQTQSAIRRFGYKVSNDFGKIFVALDALRSRARMFTHRTDMSDVDKKDFLRAVEAYVTSSQIASDRFSGNRFSRANQLIEAARIEQANELLSEQLGIIDPIKIDAVSYTHPSSDEQSKFRNKIVETTDWSSDPWLASLKDRIDDQELQLSAVDDQLGNAARANSKLRNEFEGYKKDQDKVLQNAREIVHKAENAHLALQEQLALKEASNYWSAKSGEHKKRQARWAAGLTGWLIASVIVLYFSLDHYRDHVLDAYSIFDLVPYLPSNILLITLAVWGTRVLIRQVLSELHLATRAEEKATLIQTYLALINEGAAEKEDRHLILGPVFSLSQDGLVEDDGLPPHASLLSTITGKS